MQASTIFSNIPVGTSCCFIRQHPELLNQENILPVEKWRVIFRALVDSLQNKHKNCAEQVLLNNGNQSTMKSGEYLLNQLISQAATWDQAPAVLEIFFKHGLCPIFAIKRIHVSLFNDRRLKDLHSVSLKHASGTLIPLMIRAADNQITNKFDYRFYSHNLLLGSILACNTEFLYLLRLTGTSSENMMEAINQAHCSAHIGKTQLMQMKETACKALTLQEANRITIWRRLSKKEDVSELPLPTEIKNYLLFDDTEFSMAE